MMNDINIMILANGTNLNATRPENNIDNTVRPKKATIAIITAGCVL